MLVIVFLFKICIKDCVHSAYMSELRVEVYLILGSLRARIPFTSLEYYLKNEVMEILSAV